jgi:hypothetical protein
VMIGMCVSFYRSLRAERIPEPVPRPTVTLPEPGGARAQPGEASGS